MISGVNEGSGFVVGGWKMGKSDANKRTFRMVVLDIGGGGDAYRVGECNNDDNMITRRNVGLDRKDRIGYERSRGDGDREGNEERRNGGVEELVSL